jgi:hypothetical protein
MCSFGPTGWIIYPEAGVYTLLRMNPPAGEVQSEDEYCLNTVYVKYKTKIKRVPGTALNIIV